MSKREEKQRDHLWKKFRKSTLFQELQTDLELIDSELLKRFRKMRKKYQQREIEAKNDFEKAFYRELVKDIDDKISNLVNYDPHSPEIEQREELRHFFIYKNQGNTLVLAMGYSEQGIDFGAYHYSPQPNEIDEYIQVNRQRETKKYEKYGIKIHWLPTVDCRKPKSEAAYYKALEKFNKAKVKLSYTTLNEENKEEQNQDENTVASDEKIVTLD